MAGRKLAEAFVEFGTKGFEKVQGAFGTLQKGLKGLGSAIAETTQKLDKLASKATLPFAALVGVIGKTVSVADPVRFAQFGLAFDRISLHLGRVFIPLLQEITGWLNRVADYFKGLTNEQRESILAWTKTAVGIGAVLIVLPKVISFITSLTTLLSPVGLALMAIGAVIGALGTEGLGKVFDAIKESLLSFWNVIEPVVSAVQGMVQTLIDSFSSLLEMAAPALGGLKDMFADIFGFIGQVIIKVVDSIGWVIKKLMQLVVVVGTVVKKISNLEFTGMGDAIDANLQELDSRMAGKQEQREKAMERKAEAKTNKESGDKFAPQPVVQNPKVMAALDAYRAVQTASQGATDPKLALEQERLSIARRDSKSLEQIAKNTSKPPGEQ